MIERYRCTRCTMSFAKVDEKPDYADPKRSGCPERGCRIWFWEVSERSLNNAVHCYVLRSDVQPARG